MIQTLLPIVGVKIGTSCAGIKQSERDDLVVFELADTASVAVVFTKNKFCAAPVILAKKHLLTTNPKYLIINSGNANAGLGVDGVRAAKACCDALATITNTKTNSVLPFSTGVIGESLAVEKIVSALPKAIENLSHDNWDKAALAILTTDTREKVASREVLIKGQRCVITGIAKGSGMIKPDMATMLAYIATDVSIEKSLLQSMLQEAVGLSFNRITVDGDTSTNDAVVLVASGAGSSIELKDNQSPGYEEFFLVLLELCQFLAEEIVRDGEGATKLIRIKVEQAATQVDATEVGYTIAHSPLVKTAFFASDPNWGRILAAVGRAKVECTNTDKISIYLDDVCIVRNGMKAKEYAEEAGQTVLNKKEITVRVNLAQGEHSAEILTCDLSYDYVKINAEYRT